MSHLTVETSNEHAITVTLSRAGLSKNGTAKFIETEKTGIEALNRNGVKYSENGGLIPLVGMLAAPFVITLTSFWLNPKVAITDKLKLSIFKLSIVRDLFRSHSHEIPSWEQSIKDKR